MKDLIATGLLVFAVGAAAQQPVPAPASRAATETPPSDLPVEVLAHFFLSSRGATERLEKNSIVSEDGVAKLRSASAKHWKAVHGDKDLANEARQLCKEAKKAKNGTEFAAAFIESDKRERGRLAKAATLTLSELTSQDRQELKNWLNTEYRIGFRGNGLGSNLTERFATKEFPSADSDAITRRVCETATEYEKRSEP
jgi:hypothetical protein